MKLIASGFDETRLEQEGVFVGFKAGWNAHEEQHPVDSDAIEVLQYALTHCDIVDGGWLTYDSNGKPDKILQSQSLYQLWKSKK